MALGDARLSPGLRAGDVTPDAAVDGTDNHPELASPGDCVVVAKKKGVATKREDKVNKDRFDIRRQRPNK